MSNSIQSEVLAHLLGMPSVVMHGLAGLKAFEEFPDSLEARPFKAGDSQAYKFFRKSFEWDPAGMQGVKRKWPIRVLLI